jgi:hypothetical protein
MFIFSFISLVCIFSPFVIFEKNEIFWFISALVDEENEKRSIKE